MWRLELYLYVHAFDNTMLAVLFTSDAARMSLLALNAVSPCYAFSLGTTILLTTVHMSSSSFQHNPCDCYLIVREVRTICTIVSRC